ncbi:MAG TPA: hypothetical protein VF100_12200 [Thermoanaerobaculia bacterium]
MTSDPVPPGPVSLAAALAERADRHPHRPFLFWPEGLDWRWMSFAEAVGEVERLREGRPARAVDERAVPAAVIEVLEQIAKGDGGATRGLVERAIELSAVLASDAEGESRGERREIVVAAPPIAGEGGRFLLAWAVLADAAVVVEPSRTGLVATAAWARPTVFRGTVAEIAALATEAAAAERAGFAGFRRRVRRWLGGDPPPPRPFGRLHTLVVGDGPADAVDAAFWRTRGTRLLAEPSSSDAAPSHRSE